MFFLHRGYLAFLAPVKPLNLAVVPELGDVVGGRLDPQHDPELVVHLDGHCTHLVLDSRAENACVEVVAYLALVVSVELFLPQEGGDVLRFDGEDGGTHQSYRRVGSRSACLLNTISVAYSACMMLHL